jgi:N-acetylmuramoyl-L-alanine amidase
MGYDIVLSYGHGEETYRVKHSKGVTVNGVQYAEHTHNYQVGTRVKAIVERHGVSVLEVQPPNGVDIPLRMRTDKANAANVKLYYSIHSNSGASTARGWCGFYWSTSAAGKRIAEIYARNMAAIGLPLYHGGTWGSVKGTWNDFHELRETHMVALLTENGFMTNPEDFQYIFLNKDGYWDRMAEAHAKTILEYLGKAYIEKAPEQAPVAPTPVAPSGTFRIKVITQDLWYYDRPDWNAKKALVHAGDVFTVVETLVVNGSKMYKLKSGTYITASPKYVQVM